MSSKSQLKKAKKAKKLAAKMGESNSGDVKLSLAGFLSPYIPDCTAIKLVYSDYRTLTAVAFQADYVYRCNSIFDPDFTGTGGQPDGYDQWANLYTQYRVVAFAWEVGANCNGANTQCGLLAVVPTTTSASFASAEEVAGLRKAKSVLYTNSVPGYVRGLIHISELTGQSDSAVLANNDFASAIGGNPNSPQFFHVAAETNSSGGTLQVWAKLTYYVRFEKPVATIDAASRHRRLFARDCALSAAVASSAGADDTSKQMSLPSNALPPNVRSGLLTISPTGNVVSAADSGLANRLELMETRLDRALAALERSTSLGTTGGAVATNK